MAKWWGRQEAEEKEGEIEVKPPKEITEKLDKIDTLATEFGEFKTKSAVLDRMTTFLDEQEASKAAARTEAARVAAAKATETKTAEVDELWLTDPKQAWEKQAEPLKIATLNAQSMHIRREVFDDQGEYEYYTGEFKKEVDNLIENSLNPTARVDPQSIKNCYYLVLGRKQKEIKEGKLKSRFSAMTTASAKSGEGKADEGQITLTDEMKRAAEKLGVKQEDYAKQAREMGYV